MLAERVHNVGGAGTLRSYDNVTLGSGFTNANNAAYYDNVWVRRFPIPEPASCVLLALGSIVMIAGRRRAA